MTMVQAIVISGIVCGISGVVQASGVSETLSVEVSGGVGYTAIIIACLAKYNPYMITLVSFTLCYSCAREELIIFKLLIMFQIQ